MKFTLKTCLAGAAALAMVGSAAAQAAGSVQSTTGDTGSVVVVRDGEIYSIGAGDQVFPGDVIATRTVGSVVISANGCVVTLDGGEEVTIDESFCQPAAVREASVAGGESGGFVAGNTGAILLGAGAVAVLAAIAADDDDDDPVSP